MRSLCRVDVFSIPLGQARWFEIIVDCSCQKHVGRSFGGYAYSQLHKMRTKKPEGKRIETIEKYGYDVKFAYHVVRLLDEVEQILTIGDLDITRDRERLKAIRSGEWEMERVEQHFENKERILENAMPVVSCRTRLTSRRLSTC